MIVSFDRLPEQLVSGFKGGDGVVSVRPMTMTWAAFCS